jgi:hypothetical protein
VHDPVGLDVVRVAVAAVLVVADQYLGADLAQHADQVGGRGVQVGLPEAIGALVGRGVHHSGVAVAAGAAEESVVGDAQRRHGRRELADAVLAKAVVLVSGQMSQLRDEDLALLAERAGHQGDPGALRGVHRHGGPRIDDLVIRMGVHHHHSAGGRRGSGVGGHDGECSRRPPVTRVFARPTGQQGGVGVRIRP